MRPYTSFLLGTALLGGAAPALGEPVCRPSLLAREVALSEASRMQRTWTAHILVDAARCATASGRFTIHFIRLKEDAPDAPFSEQFTWTPGEIDVSTLFAADEAVLRFSIEPAVCPCR